MPDWMRSFALEMYVWRFWVGLIVGSAALVAAFFLSRKRP